MIECNTLEEARAVPNLIHIEAGKPVKAWQQGDTLPSHCVVVPATPEQLKAAARADARRILSDPEALAILMRARDIVNFKLFKTLLPTLTKAAYLKMITDEIDNGAADK